METELTTVWIGDGNINQPSKSFVKMLAVSSSTFSSLHFLQCQETNSSMQSMLLQSLQGKTSRIVSVQNQCFQTLSEMCASKFAVSDKLQTKLQQS